MHNSVKDVCMFFCLIMVFASGSALGEGVKVVLDDCSNPEAWKPINDALAAEVDTRHIKKKESCSLKFMVKPKKGTNGDWRNDTHHGDLSLYKDEYITMWFYVEDPGGFQKGVAMSFSIGNNFENRVQYHLRRNKDMKKGWNFWKINLSQPDREIGKVNWKDISFTQLVLWENRENPQDITVYINEINLLKEIK